MKMTNRKKVRNWSRHRRKIEAWYRSQHRLRLSPTFTRDHVKLYVHPWSHLVRRNPPVWLQRVIANCLVDIALAWKSQLEATGRKYYLKIWFFSREFSRSQVVCAIEPSPWVETYENTFEAAPDSFPSFPISRYLPGRRLENNFRIERGNSCNYFFPHLDAEDYSEEELRRIEKRARRVCFLEDGARYLVMDEQPVWLLTP